jgi:hypothetical protein
MLNTSYIDSATDNRAEGQNHISSREQHVVMNRSDDFFTM